MNIFTWIEKHGIGILLCALWGAGCVFLLAGTEKYYIASGSVFSAATILYLAYCYQKDSKNKSSEFYLQQIQRYFSTAERLLLKRSSNTIIWNQAIHSLKAAESLYDRLTEDSHVEIYLTDYLNTAYSILQVTNPLSYKFFFGIPDFEHRNDTELYKASRSNSVGTSIARICPDMLYFLVCFIDKASRVSHDTINNKKSLLDCRHQDYFVKIDDDYKANPIMSGVMNIMDYISVYRAAGKISPRELNVTSS